MKGKAWFAVLAVLVVVLALPSCSGVTLAKETMFETENFVLEYNASWTVGWEGVDRVCFNHPEEFLCLTLAEWAESPLEETRQNCLRIWASHASEIQPLSVDGRDGFFFIATAEDGRVGKYVFFENNDEKDHFFVLIATPLGNLKRVERIFATLSWK